MSDKVETAPLAVRRDRSVASRRPARQARARRDRRIIDPWNRGVSVAEIAEREDVVEKPTRDRPAKLLVRTRRRRPARKWRRKDLKRLNPGREMVWARTPRTHNIWYKGARLTARDSGCRAARTTKSQSGQKKAPEALKSLDAELKSAPVAAGNGGARLVRGGSAPRLGAADRRPSALSGAGKKKGRATGREIFLAARP